MPPTAPLSTGVPDRARLSALRRTVREVGLALIVAGVIVLLFVTYQLFGTTFHERHAQNRLAQQFQAAVQKAEHPSSSTTPPTSTGTGHTTSRTTSRPDNPTVSGPSGDLSPSTPSGAAIGHLVIPAIGVNKFVVQGTDVNDLSMGPGHYVGTPFPGQPGNSGIAGHRTTYGAPFFELNRLKRGDKIYITVTSGKTYTYVVLRQEVVSPTDGGVLDPSSHPELTLTTCNPRFSDVTRLVVVSSLVGRPTTPPKPSTSTKSSGPGAASTSGHPTAGTVNQALGSGNSAGWPPAILFGALTLLAWVLTRLAVHRTRRLRRAASLVVGVAVCLVPLWFCFENIIRLLPPTI